MSTQLLQEPCVRHSPTPSVQALDVTVAIPTYNGAKRLPAVLERLRSQQGLDNITWEVIVCDNNSLDETRAVVEDYQQNWGAAGSLTYRFAPEQGAAFARQRAVEVAQGEIIAFLDDDNLPALDWVAQAYQFSQTHPQAAAWGSQIHGKFEGDLPDNFDKLACYLAIIERGSKPHRYDPETKILPPGAGLVVRREAWLNAVPARLFLNNKGKAAGLASEDLEAVLHIQKAGGEIWYNPDMVVHHEIPNSRLQRDYMMSLLKCIGLSRFYIRLLGTRDWQRPLVVPAYIANDIRKLALHWLKYRDVSEDLLASCQRAHLASTVASPLFLLKTAYQKARQDLQVKATLPQRDQWVNQLTQAFEEDRFSLHSQAVLPIAASLGTEQHCEVLLRMNRSATSEVEGLVSPREFMPVAEHLGLTRTIDRWVIRRFAQLLQAQARQNTLDQQRIYSINLSQDSARDRTLVNFIADQITIYGISAKHFCFELPEAAIVAYPDEVRDFAQALNELGCPLIIDDVNPHRFEQRVLNMPVKYLKFSNALGVQPRRRSAQARMTDAIRASHDRGIQTIAKGVESIPILHAVKQLGVLYAQGYHLAQPSPLVNTPSR